MVNNNNNNTYFIQPHCSQMPFSLIYKVNQVPSILLSLNINLSWISHLVTFYDMNIFIVTYSILT